MIDDKRREWLEKVISIKKKKEEELKQLEDKKKEELKEAEEIIKSGIEEMDQQEEEEITDALKKKEPVKKEEINLEETVQQEKINEEVKQEQQITYKANMEELLSSPSDVSGRSGLYSGLKETLEKVQNGEYLSREERESVYKTSKGFDEVERQREDSFGYVERSKQVLTAIQDNLHRGSTYKSGDDH